MQRDSMKKSGRPKGTSKGNGWKYLTEKQLKDFMTAVAKGKSLRDYVIFSLTLYLGLRVQEIVNIELKDIDSDMMGIAIQGVKSGRCRTYPDLNEKLWKKLQRYIRTLNKREIYLLPSPRIEGQALTTQAVKDLFKKYARTAGLSSDYSIHTLRHACAMLKAKNNESPIKIMLWLRHRSISSTQKYFEQVVFERDAEDASRVFGNFM